MLKIIASALLLCSFLVSSPAKCIPPAEMVAALKKIGSQLAPGAGFELMQKLGIGTYGEVYQVRQGVQHNAFKFFKCDGGELWSEDYCEAVSFLIKEIQIMIEAAGSGSNPNLMHAIGWVVPDGEHAFGIIMPLMRTDLARFIRHHQHGIPRRILQNIVLQIAGGLTQLHRLGHTHCDLKPQNILLDDRFNVKITDFGAADADHEDASLEICTRWFRSPEWVLRGPYTQTADVFSFACILHECVTGVALFGSSDTSELGHLFRVFRLVGTPNPSNWPGVEALPHYSDQFPKWGDRRDEFFTRAFAAVPEYIPIVIAAIALNPGQRLRSEDLHARLSLCTLEASTSSP